MHGLNATLSQASQALSAESGALAVTNNNIANVNTVGYSREIVNLSATALNGNDAGVQGSGVTYNGYTSVRSEVLGISIQQKTAEVGNLDAQGALWAQIESAFSGTTSGVGASISSLFSSLSTLSVTPANAGVRQAALSAAGNVADAFHQAAATLTGAQSQANSSLSGIVANINHLTSQIASLDQQLAASQAAGKEGGSIEDQRNELTTQLAALTDITSTATQSTPSLSTANGSPLVVDGKSYALQVMQGGDGKTRILDGQGNDITSSLTGGSLGGNLAMRDTAIPQLSASLDTMAAQFAAAMNTAQTKGYDASGNEGTALFTLPTDGSSAAAGINLALAGPGDLALSSDGTSGSSGNLSAFLAVQTSPLPAGQTPTDIYASLVQRIGGASASVSSRYTATSAALTQLTSQQASESGVSIDEETTNLLRFQQAYMAAAKVVSVVNDLYSALMNMSVVG